MNSKMMALAAVLVVGVLAAAGVGYAYTAQYTSPDEIITPNFVVVKNITEGDIDYNTTHDASGTFPVYTTTVKTSETAGYKGNTFEVLIDASTMPAAGTLALTSYTVYFQDGGKVENGTFTAATQSQVVTATTVTLALTDTTYTVEDNQPITLTLAGTITSTGSATVTAAPSYVDHVELLFTATPTIS